MRQVLVLAHNTFREAVRDRVLTTILVFGGAIVLSSAVLAPLTLGEETRVVRDLGLAAINVFSMLMIVMVGTSLVYREIEHRTIYVILTLPVKRSQFVLGKYLGLCATMFVSIAILSSIYFTVVLFYGGGLHAPLFIAIALTALEAAIVIAVAIFFSTVASPLLSAVFTFLVYVAGHLTAGLRELAAPYAGAPARVLLDVMDFVLPALHHFDVRNNIVSLTPVDPGQVFYCVGYTVFFSGALLLLTMAAFQRRDFE